MSAIDPLSVQRGSIIAPAGCGKTYTIAASLLGHTESKPVLVLTHTNAGVSALKKRLAEFKVPPSSYRLATIDGWAKRIIGHFPERSGHDPKVLEIENPGRDYPAIKKHAVDLLLASHITDILKASYSRLLVDEYQDCMMQQHQIVVALASIMPTCVFGDELQCIFSWSGDKPDWEGEVLKQFPVVCELETPHRWINAGKADLGDWLLAIRPVLKAGGPIDLRDAPADVVWMELDGVNDEEVFRKAAQSAPPIKGGSVLIICKGTDKPRQQKIARETPGAVLIENVDLTHFINFAENFNFGGQNATHDLIDFARSMMTGVGASNLKARLTSLTAGSATKAATKAEQALLDFLQTPSPKSANDVLVAINNQSGVGLHRPTILSACLRTLNSCSDPAEFKETAVAVREQQRIVGREVRGRAVGSTLLVKGLEADVSVVLDTTPIGAEDLYVALTRGAHKIVVCSPTPIISPKS